MARATSTSGVGRLRVVPPPPRRKLVEDAVLGMALFLMAEVMMFAGLISAFLIVKNGVDGGIWPPPGQPRLPVWETALNTGALFASAVVLWFAWRSFREEGAQSALRKLGVAILLGGFFVAFQGIEWVMLLGQGLTMQSSQLGGFFYLIVGCHAAHAIGALYGLVWAYRKLKEAKLTGEWFAAVALFWYFVVGIWPILYWQVYL